MTDPAFPEGAAAAERAGGDRLRLSGRGLAALLRYDRALCLAPDDPVTLHNRALAMAGLGRLDEAVTGYRRALRLMPDNPVVLSNLGLAEQRRGRLPEALACFRTVAAMTPDSPAAWASLGDALARAGDADMACLCLRRALTLDPAMVAAYVNLAAAARRSGDRDGAIAACRHALSLQSGQPAVLSNLGGLLVDLGRASEAVACLRQAIAADPVAAPAYYNLALALRALGLWDLPGVPGARDMCRRLIHLTPDHAGGRLLAVTGTLPIVAMTAEDSALAPARFAAALEELEAWGRAHPLLLGASLGSSQPFHLAYRPGNHRAILSRLGDLASGAAAARWPVRPPAAAAPDGRPIRIGVVSAHVRRHPVWDIVLKGLVSHLDRTRFRLFLYHTGAETDAETVRARQLCPDFRQGPLSVERWIGVIGQDAPDILYYPEIGMDPTAFALAALRLARVQAAGWGHPITTGLPEMDLFLSGELLEDPDAGDHYRETLVRLPGTGVCTEPVPVQVLPWDGADAVMPAGGRTASDGGGQPVSDPDGRGARTPVHFALCQTPFKFDPAFDGLYVRIARAVGGCRFWLVRDASYPWASERLLERLAARFAADGLDPARHLRMVPWMPPDRFAGFLDAMDISLDCPAFSGYTTAWAASHRGLPTVTLEGAFLRQRLAAGLLRRIGMAGAVARSLDDYVSIVVGLTGACRRPDRRDALRRRWRAHAGRADGDVQAVRAMEKALADAIWERTGR